MTDQEPEEPQHWPTERMITEGHAEYATVDDLRPLDIDTLSGIADLCEVGLAAPDECIPCWAYAEIQERRKPPEEDEPEGEDPVLSDPLITGPVDTEPVAPLTTVLRQQALSFIETLNAVLDGPPIPPKDVSLEELATLTLAAKNWIRLMDAQGLELSPKQQILLDETRRLVSRLRGE